jgi:hypothetical protein
MATAKKTKGKKAAPAKRKAPPAKKTAAAKRSAKPDATAIPPDFEATLDEDTVASLQSVTGPRDYVLRTRAGMFLHDVSDLVIANQLARAMGVRVKVFKRTPEGEVLMSYSGPGKWD